MKQELKVTNPQDQNQSDSESLDNSNGGFDMDAFLEEDGYNEFIKEEEAKKKKEEADKANGGTQNYSSVFREE